MAFGFTPKHIEEFYLEKFSPHQFLILAIESAKNVGWDISFVSETGFVAYLNNGHFKWNAEITFKIEGKLATLKSKSVGSEMFDWGKNRKTIEEFADVFISLKYSMKTEELNLKYEELKPNIVLPEQDILNQPLLTKTDKIKEFFSIFIPREGFFITPILIDINILIYILMVFSGVNFFLPDSQSLLTWGANFRPLTSEGEWWRLITNCFLHIGIFHLLMNMYALLYIGLLLEHRIGKVKFAFAYILTGVAASISSLWWHELTISAGASGAIFGLYGIFLALLTTNLIEKATRKALLTSIGIFVMYNLLYGMKGGIDNAAHIGGLIGGLVIGFSFYPSLVKPEFKTRNLLISSTTVVGISIILFLIISNTPNTIGKYDSIMKEFADREQKAMSFYRIPQPSADERYLSAIKDEGIPNWRECRKLINNIDSIGNLPSELAGRTLLLKKYCDYRVKCFELMAESIERQTNIFNYQIDIYNQKIELIIKKLNGEPITDSLININSALDFAPKLPEGILYVVDGRPVDDISNIKPEEIKSVLVLKREASYQLYGERGKEGSLMIETK